MTDKNTINETDALLASVPHGLIAEDILADLEKATQDYLAETRPAADGAADPGFDIGIDRASIYADQDGGFTVHDPEDVAPVSSGETLSAEPDTITVEPVVTTNASKRSRRKAAAAAATPAAPVTPAEPKTAPERQKKALDASGLSDLGYDDDAVTTLLGEIASAPKKVSEKATNFLRFALGREHLSNYTRFTLARLQETEALTVPELVKQLEGRGYSAGTARSQAQQMSRMFVIFGMVSKDGSKMTLDGEHVLVKRATDRFKGLPAPSKANDVEEVLAEDQANEGDQFEALVGGTENAPSPPPSAEKPKRKRNRAKKAVPQVEEMAQAA